MTEPVLDIQPNPCDLGLLPLGREVSRDVTLMNTGWRNLNISECRSTCGCLRLELSRQRIPPLFSLHFWNAVYFVACAAIVAIGYRKRQLSTHEFLLTIGLLGIPYVLQGYRMMMAGHGRFTCVVFPMFIVLGRWMSALPVQLTSILWALMAVQLFYWSALFASWNYVF